MLVSMQEIRTQRLYASYQRIILDETKQQPNNEEEIEYY
jgi:hypothetical protein